MDTYKGEEVAHDLKKNVVHTKLGMVENDLDIKMENNKRNGDTNENTIAKGFGVCDAKITKIPLNTGYFKL